MNGLSDTDVHRIAKAVVEQARAEHKSFYIEPEEHYLDHMALREWRGNMGIVTKIVMTIIVGLLVAGIGTFIVIGLMKGSAIKIAGIMLAQIWG